MTLYLDTSSLVKLYVAEAESESVRRLVDDADIVATAAIAYPEARAALALLLDALGLALAEDLVDVGHCR